MRKPVVVRLFGVRARVRFVDTIGSLMRELYRVIRIGSKHGAPDPDDTPQTGTTTMQDPPFFSMMEQNDG